MNATVDGFDADGDVWVRVDGVPYRVILFFSEFPERPVPGDRITVRARHIPGTYELETQ